MSRSTYAPKETYLGNGALDTYTFDFKIEAKAQLLVIEVNDSGVETERVDGNDAVYLSSVTFDSVDGAGTVVLAANLPTDYNLILLLANDAPTQPYEFANKTTFTLKRFESALDYIAGAVQRLAYRGKQSLRIHDLDDEDAFDAQLPAGADAALDKCIVVNSAGDGLDFGPTTDEISNAQGYAVAAAVAQADAETAQAAAEAAQAAAVIAQAAAVAAQAAAEAAQTAAELAQSTVEAYYQPVATENIAEGGDISVTQSLVGYRQYRRIAGDGAAKTASTTPFGVDNTYFVDGMSIKLEGQSDTNTVIVEHNDAQYGCLLNGDWMGDRGNVLELTYNSSLERFLESSRGN